MARMILSDKRSYRKIFNENTLKQKGLCLHCGKMIGFGEKIVSNGKKSKYYHEACAKKLLIL
jgi:hypothetical protein